jgi:hypothetical protein
MTTIRDIQALFTETKESNDDVASQPGNFLHGPTNNELPGSYNSGATMDLRAHYRMTPDLVYAFQCRVSQVLQHAGAQRYEDVPPRVVKALTVI